MLPLTWSQKNTTGGTVTPVVVGGVTTGAFRGTTVGLVTLGVELTNPGSEPQVTGVNRQATAPAVVVEAQCRDQLLSPAATATSEADPTSPASRVDNPGNVIDNDPVTRGTFVLGASLLNGELSMSFNRSATPVTTTQAREVGFVVAYNPASPPDFILDLLDATGAVITARSNDNPAVVGPATRPEFGTPRTNFAFHTIKTSVPAGVTFTGARISVVIPTILDNLAAGSTGASTQVDVYTACAEIVQ